MQQDIPQCVDGERPDILEKFENVAGQFQWRWLAPNGEIISTSEAYPTKSNLERSVQRAEQRMNNVVTRWFEPKGK